MNISKVQLQLNNEDILSIINEFIDVEELEFKSLTVDKDLILEGSYCKGINIDFKAKLLIEGVKDRKIYLRVKKVKILNLGIFSIIRSFALKKVLKIIPIEGMDSKKDTLIIDLHKMLIDVPYVNIDMRNIYIRDNNVYVEADNVNISIKGELIKVKEKVEEESEEDEIEYPINKVIDNYTAGRKVISEKLPVEVPETVSDILFVIPDMIALIYRLLKDKRVRTRTKLSVSASVAYILFKVDLIPDKIPLIGKVDNIAVLFFALNRIAEEVPAQVLAENWEGKYELISVLKSGLEYLINFTNANNVEKLYNVVEELSTL